MDRTMRTKGLPEKMLLRFSEAAMTLSIGRSTLYTLVAQGQLPVVRIGRAVRIPAGALTEWVRCQSMRGHEEGQGG